MTPKLEDQPTRDSTSAEGAMQPYRTGARVSHCLVFIESGTASRYVDSNQPALLADAMTSSGYAPGSAPGLIEPTDTRTAIAELRRLSGLTWERLAKVLGVSRRSLHFWASGKPINTANEERLFRMLAVLKAADRGSARENRAMLLTEQRGVIPVDLLAMGRCSEFLDLVGRGPGRPSSARSPLSEEASAARRPLPPEDLVDALQDRVHRDEGVGRAVRTLRHRRRKHDG